MTNVNQTLNQTHDVSAGEAAARPGGGLARASASASGSAAVGSRSIRRAARP